MKMEASEDFEDSCVGYYRCRDPSSLLIRLSVTSNGSSEENRTETTLQWQQKLFSARELREYDALESPQTHLERRFKQEAARQQASVSAAPASSLPSICTHVADEDFTIDYQRRRRMLSPELPPTLLAERLMQLMYRPPASHCGAEPTESEGRPAEDGTLTSPQQRVRRLAATPVRSMLIMLHVEEEEHLLCRLDWNGSGQLTVRPDFNRAALPYRLQVGDGRKGQYAYHVEWLQWPHPPQGQTVAALRHQRSGAAATVLPPPAAARFLVLHGELVTAAGFPRDNLFLHYFLELPKGWEASADTRLWGLSQLSRADASGRCHFSLPISAELHVGPAGPGEEQAEVLRWPTLYVEVLSEDCLGVSRTEGYCHVTLPAAAGHQTRRLAAWRPFGDRTSRLRRFFLGGAPELQKTSYVGVPTDFQGDRLSRYGFSTETVGEVEVRLWSLHHGQPAGDSGLAPAARVTDVLQAFKRARLRMLRARQQLANGAGQAQSWQQHSVRADTRLRTEQSGQKCT